MQRTQWSAVDAVVPGGADETAAETAAPSGRGSRGVFVFRERDELYQRINQRVESIFEDGVTEQVRAAGVTSSTAAKMIGLREIREVMAGNISAAQCIAAIQQSTRRYAKRQLTWFRRQTNLEPLNLSLLSHDEAVKWITQRVSLFCAKG
jgi:tRNA dimethylallyltransferase